MERFWKFSRVMNLIAWIGCGFTAGIYFRLVQPIVGVEFALLSVANGFFFILNPYKNLK